jgi:hypothetical protein
MTKCPRLSHLRRGIGRLPRELGSRSRFEGLEGQLRPGRLCGENKHIFCVSRF